LSRTKDEEKTKNNPQLSLVLYSNSQGETHVDIKNQDAASTIRGSLAALTDAEPSLFLRACDPHRFSIHNHNIILREPRPKQTELGSGENGTARKRNSALGEKRWKKVTQKNNIL